MKLKVFHESKNCCRFPDVLSEIYFKMKVRGLSITQPFWLLQHAHGRGHTKKRQKHMYYRYGTPASQCEEGNTTTGWKGCHNKPPQTGWVKQQILFLQFWRLSSRTVTAGLVGSAASLPGLQTAAFWLPRHSPAILSHPASRHVQTSLSNRDNC